MTYFYKQKGHKLHGKKGRKYYHPDVIVIKEKFELPFRGLILILVFIVVLFSV